MADALKKPTSLYESDFYAWTVDQAEKLRARATFDNRGDIDWENAAEEIESVGRSDKREIRSRLEVLLLHLLKWRFQSKRRKHGWRDTIVEQRRRLPMVVDDSPSLREYPVSVLDDVYALAVIGAARETGLPKAEFPLTCPFTIDQILHPDFYPDAE